MNEENKKAEAKKQEPADGSPGRLTRLFRTYKAEFKKIVWPSREQLVKHTLTVMVVSLIFGIYIAIVDGIFGAAFSRFVELVS